MEIKLTFFYKTVVISTGNMKNGFSQFKFIVYCVNVMLAIINNKKVICNKSFECYLKRKKNYLYQKFFIKQRCRRNKKYHNGYLLIPQIVEC